jgi:uncharacterized 2Fe-2S/4Fe-4S cluster protein (DUF4445 family)
MNSIKIKRNSKTVLETLREDFNIPIDAFCGGKGTCGKCKVQILDGETNSIGDDERKYLTFGEVDKGFRLACKISPIDELHLSLEHISEGAQILESHNGYDGELNPLVKKSFVQLEKPDLNNQSDDLARILKAINLHDGNVSLNLRQNIPSILRQNDYSVTAVYNDRSLISLEAGSSVNENYAIACDIGTTTVVAYLLNTETGEIIDTVSELNSQKPFGADVIARIEFCMKDKKEMKLLQEKILSLLGSMSLRLLKNNLIDKKNLYSVTVAGNTTMLHLLAGVDPAGIAVAPFIPAFLGGFNCSASELGKFPIDCLFYFMPSISAYVGADIVADVLATGMFETEDLSLLVDLGTNGEIIFGNKDKLYSCATAAGPAFEGAHISCGMGAVSGALNSFKISDKIEYSSIGDIAPAGICGSAIVDVIAQFLEKGIMDETGRFSDIDDIEDDKIKELFEKYYKDDGEGAFILVPAEESGTGEDILFTQKDIREVQLAKAAIAAGIETLLHDACVSKNDIKHLYIAGGFGNYIDKECAATIGLIPSDLLGRTVSVGNTAGLGAINCSFSIDNLTLCDKIINNTKYIELSGSTFFQQKYMEEMMF